MKDREVERIEPVLALVQQVWKKYPDMRLTQLIFAAASKGGWKGDDVFYCEDDVLATGLSRFIGANTAEVYEP